MKEKNKGNNRGATKSYPHIFPTKALEMKSDRDKMF